MVTNRPSSWRAGGQVASAVAAMVVASACASAGAVRGGCPDLQELHGLLAGRPTGPVDDVHIAYPGHPAYLLVDQNQRLKNAPLYHRLDIGKRTDGGDKQHGDDRQVALPHRQKRGAAAPFAHARRWRRRAGRGATAAYGG